MEWSQEYSVGIHEIDEQHKTLVECVSAIEQAVGQIERLSAVQLALARLARFADIHFSVEESLMRIHDYPGLHEHVQDHLRLSERLRVLQEHSLKADVSQDMIEFLRNWIEMHVRTHDKPYAFHFLKRTALGKN
jgi:hemerythrin